MVAFAYASSVLVLVQGTAEAPASPSSQPRAEWNGTIGASLIALRGNAESISLNATGAVERRSPPWRWSAKLSAAYGEARLQADQAPTVVALAAAAQIRGDR